MGLIDIFRIGKVVAGTVKAVRQQRDIARELQALSGEAFVEACLQGLNAPAAAWSGRRRPPDARAAALADALGLPQSLRAFYALADGFEPVRGPFPLPLLPIAELKRGADCRPCLSQRLASTWDKHGNDAVEPGHMAVLPPDDLAALATGAAESHLPPEALDAMLLLCPPQEHQFSVLVLDPVGAVPAGAVLDIESGGATRYDDFKHWLATHASLFSSMAS
jgi:hypothetical protein